VADAAAVPAEPDVPVPARTNTPAPAQSPWGVKQAMPSAVAPLAKIANQIDPFAFLMTPFAAVKKITRVVGYLQVIIGLLIAIAFLK
jgi:hypothetical protein